jgi:hypothetical protein
VLPYAAYLRVYEPLSAFREPERSRWAAYAAAPQPPRRVSALEAEHADAMRRLIAVPPIVAPVRESDEAYVRRADGVVYICPWQTRLRSWLALGRLRASLPPALTDTFVPREVADRAAANFARWHADAGAHPDSLRTHILTATWHVPLAWFVPFGPPERWLVLGGDAGSDRGPVTATRTLIYLTTMAQARRRVARAIGAVRRGMSGLPASSHPYGEQRPPAGGRVADAGHDGDGGPGYGGVAHPGGPGQSGDTAAPGPASPGAMPRRGTGRHAGGPGGQDRRQGGFPVAGGTAGQAGSGSVPSGAADGATPAAVTEIEEVGRWLAEFHPRALVELDYGGLVHLLDDGALRADQSVAEVAAAITGLETGELELAVAMYQRLSGRWRALQAAETAS